MDWLAEAADRDEQRPPSPAQTCNTLFATSTDNVKRGRLLDVFPGRNADAQTARPTHVVYSTTPARTGRAAEST